MDTRDVIGGLLVAALGLFAVIWAPGYGLGNARAIGAGYFPLLIGLLCIGVGLAIAVPATLRSGAMPAVAWRPLVAIAAALLAFGLVSLRFGYVPATAACAAIAALGDRGARPSQVLLLAVIVPAGIWLVFGVGLGIAPRAWIGF